MSPELGQRVIAMAQGLVSSHYINGGYGATPGRYDGCPCRPGGIELIADENHLEPMYSANKTANLAVNAATMTIKTYCVCAGNYATFPGGPFAGAGGAAKKSRERGVSAKGRGKKEKLIACKH